MVQNDSNYVVHYQQNDDPPAVPKFLFIGGILYVVLITLLITFVAD